MIVKNFSDELLISSLDTEVATERKSTANIVEFIHEVEERQLFHKYDSKNMFEFLTKRYGYTGGTAQRRIDASRLLREIPGLRNELEASSLNITQVSMLAREVRRKEKLTKKKISASEKESLLKLVRGKDEKETARILAKNLSLPIEVREKTRMQGDGSLRLEITLSKEQVEMLERVKEVISHSRPNPKWSDLFGYLGEEFLKRRDPERKTKRAADTVKSAKVVSKRKIFTSGPEGMVRKKRETIAMALKREVFQSHKACQWINEYTGKICSSRFQLQIDHKQPIWAGGSNEIENLQLLCSTHNLLKYRLEQEFRP